MVCVYVVFVEYKVPSLKRQDYLCFMDIALAGKQVDLLEGTDESGLFVEIWSDFTEKEFAIFKEERTRSLDSPWRGLDSLLAEGLEKLHIWKFKKAR